MTPVFADSLYYIALLNPKDRFHELAREYATRHGAIMVTTEWVLTEVADGLCSAKLRARTHRFVRDIMGDPGTHVIPATAEWFERGLRLYGSRGDKDWSLTDCISFEVMRELVLTDALTADQHFVQAGFRALLADGDA